MIKEEKNYGEILSSWNFSEYENHLRSKGWYMLFFVIVVLLLIYALTTTNFLFAVIVILATMIILMRTKYEPKLVNFAICANGLLVDETFYAYDEIQDYYIVYNPPVSKELYIHFKSVWHPRLTILLQDQNPIQIRELLSDYLEEDMDKENEPVSESFRKYFKL